MNGVKTVITPSLRRLATACAMMTLAAGIWAQPATNTPAAPPRPDTASRLQTLENTYATNLRKLHAPVLADYLRDLERLRQSLIAKDRSDEAKQVEEEIIKVRKVLTTTSIFDFPVPKKESPRAAEPEPKRPKPMGSNAATLLAADATVNSGKGTALTKDSPSKAVLLGTAEWNNVTVPAGTYDILVVRASPQLEAPRTVTCVVAGQTLSRVVKPTDNTGGEDAFRILRLGTVTLDHDLANTSLSLSVDEPDKPFLWVRSVLFGQPKSK